VSEDPEAPRLLVDGMNVIGASPDGWWRDRQAAMRTLIARLSAYSAASGRTITVVLDGRPRCGVEEAARATEGAVTVVFAPGGPGAADDQIVRLAAADSDPAGLAVVTSDAALARRVRGSGASVIGAGRFRRQLGGGRLTR
jgi:predicted RNA-binding protein with PIN domain